LFIIAVTAYEVTARYVFNRPTFWGHETAGMIYGAYILLGSAFTLVFRASPAHIKMDIIYTRFSLRKKAIVDLVGSLTFFLFVGVVLWQGWLMSMRSLNTWEHTMSPWGPPIYPLKWCMPIGAFLMLVMGTARLVKRLYTAITGKEVA
ncbi:TRAP transporter small permease subunit, partial [Chloroflexota bacterium]